MVSAGTVGLGVDHQKKNNGSLCVHLKMAVYHKVHVIFVMTFVMTFMTCHVIKCHDIYDI